MDSSITSSQEKIILSRSIFSLVLTALTFIFLVIAVIAIGVEYKNPLTSDEADCSLKAGFGLFVVAAHIEVLLFTMECIAICMIRARMLGTKTCCRCERYHLRFILHFVSATMVLIGAIIYGAENKDKVKWSFWMAFIAAVLSIINGLIWSFTMQFQRYITKGGVGGAGDAGGGFGADAGGGFGADAGGGFGADAGGGFGADAGGGFEADAGGGFEADAGGDFGADAGGGFEADAGGDVGGDVGGGDFGGNDQGGGDLGGGDFGGGDLAGGGDFSSDPVLEQELKAAPLESGDLGSGDPVLNEELKAAPVEVNSGMNPVGGIGINMPLPKLPQSGIDMPLPKLPQSVGLDVELAQKIDTSGLVIDENEPKKELTSEQLDYIEDLNI